ncbi:MAG TPA: tripartite tricarboxylate transporter substrate binding protein [Burkholderiales bacterium]|nr:tripartite tricarboxylate transporter substrate binding protein [Burkholderiales bacterium]
MKNETQLFSFCAALALACSSVVAHAQAYPTKPVRIVNPFTPGGGVDTVARPIAQQLSEMWGQPVIIDNRPGAGTTMGTELVARATPDGYTLLLTNGSIGTVPGLYKKLSFDPLKDLAPAVLTITSPYVLSVHPSVKATSVTEFITLAKASGSKMAYSSVGQGSLAHLTMELFKSQAKFDMLHVPYKGGAPSLAALMGGEIQASFQPISSIMPHARSGKLRALAVSSLKRVELAAELPSIAESGFPGFDAVSWYPIFAPAGTPRPLIQKINADVNRILAKPDMRERFLKIGMIPFGGTPQALGDYFRTDVKRWNRIIADLGIKPE